MEQEPICNLSPASTTQTQYPPFIASPSLAKLAPALLSAQKKLKNPEKDKRNPHFGNTYASLGATLDSVLQALNSEDIALLQLFVPSDSGTIGLRTVLLHKSGEFISGLAVIPLTKADAQGYGSAATYARRYGAQAIIGAVADDDDDAEAATATTREPVKKALFPGRK